MVTMSTIRRRVNRGVALLNTIRHGWYNNVNVETLDIQGFHRCVLGQVFGGYGLGCDAIEKHAKPTDEFLHRKQHGFTEDNLFDEEKLKPLNDFWKRKIRKLQAAN